MIENLLPILYVFLAVYFVDIVWVFYIKYVSMSKVRLASAQAVVVYGLSALAIITYTSNPWFLIPACIGAYFGTYHAIKFHDYLENIELPDRITKTKFYKYFTETHKK